MKKSFNFSDICARGYKPLKMARYKTPARSGTLGFILWAFPKRSEISVSAIYNTPKGEVVGEPCALPGLKVYLKAKAGREAGIYNMRGERVTLEAVTEEKAG